MVIISEGIDGTGRDTFCKRLSESTGIPVLKQEDFDIKYWMWRASDKDVVRKVMVEKMKSILNVVDTFDTSIIINRFHLYEYVYGRVDRHTWFGCGLEEIDEELKKRKAKVVCFHPITIEGVKSEYEQCMRKAVLRSKCDITDCTELEMETMVNMFTRLCYEGDRNKWL